MSSTEESWESRPDVKTTQKGVGVLIDIEYLTSSDTTQRSNPYYIVVGGVRYYGPSPEEVLESVRKRAAAGTLPTEPPSVAKRAASTALSAARTAKNRVKNGLGRVGSAVKGVGSRMFSKKTATPSENRTPLLSATTGGGKRRRRTLRRHRH
jgi:hypothetical protein